MKKTFLLLVMIFGMTLKSSANPVSPEEALKKAKAFLNQSQAMRVKGNRSLQLAYTMMPAQRKDEEPTPLLYAFNVSGDGFVIVSGDDATPAVLGYGGDGHFDIDSIPCGMRFWLDMCAEQIPLAAKQKRNSPAKVVAATTTNRVSIPPLIDVEWGQREPYNDQCIFDGDRCLTGCVATAMAQVAYYWGKGKEGRHFRHGCGAIESYGTFTNKTIPALDAVSSFNWDAMTMTDGQPDTEEAKAAVAQLMRYCGQVVGMHYSPVASGAFLGFVSDAFKDYFGYSGEIDEWQGSYFEKYQNHLLYDDLRRGYPIILSGERGKEMIDGEGEEHAIHDAHSFVCDGYDANSDSYHINWGWDGNNNGYFWLDFLDPNLEGFSREDIINEIENQSEEDEYGPGGEIIEHLEPDPYCELKAILGIAPWRAYKQLVGDQLTYYYDGNMKSREGAIYKINKNPILTEVKKIIIDESFSDYTSRSEASPNSHSAFDVYFDRFYNVEEYEGLENLNMKGMTNMNLMFDYNLHLKHLDLSTFNTSNIKVMNRMFYGCRELESLDVHSFDTSNVTNMDYMFYKCESLRSLDLSNFYIGKETNTNYMLAGMPKLSSLKISRSMSRLGDNDCSGTGTLHSPCVIQAPEGFDFGTETDGPYFMWKSGYFRLADSYAWGDVNHDGDVNITDVSTTVAKVLGHETGDFYMRNADFDEDHNLSVTDVTLLVRTILNPSSRTPKIFTCPDDHHPHYLDLGLPSGTKWACCNVGADTPEGYGDYYAWGETEKKEVYDWSSYIHCDGDGSTCHHLGDDIAGTQYDVAHVKWGGNWRMPSEKQMEELVKNSTFSWTTKDGINGALFTGPSGGTIFMPSSGVYTDESPNSFINGYYWSSTLTSNESYARMMDFKFLEAQWGGFDSRCVGLPVRPVWIGK